MEDRLNKDYMFQGVSTALLSKAVKNEIDLLKLAKRELASRGLDGNGLWVGFEEAKKIHNL